MKKDHGTERGRGGGREEGKAVGGKDGGMERVWVRKRKRAAQRKREERYGEG